MEGVLCAPFALDDPLLLAFPTPVPTPTPSPPTLNPSPPWPESQPAPPATIMTSAAAAVLPPMSLDPFPPSVTVVNVQAMPAGGIYYAVPNDRGSIRQGRKMDFSELSRRH